MRNIRNLLKKIIVSIAVCVDKTLVRMHIVRPKIVMYVDGGLCSQMTMWANGEYYTEQGLDVYYDLEWFKRYGKGIDGVSVRNYELEILWPHLRVRTLPRWKILFYRLFLPWHEESCILPEKKLINRSVYFKGYCGISQDDKCRIYHQNFSINKGAMTKQMQLDNSKQYCGVHVRRGDLANISIKFYPQVIDGYFLRAIDYVLQHEHVDEFLLFSDDPQWVREHILPKVSAPCRILEGNKGYEDLMLLAQCDVIISSQGSFGKTAALINQHCRLLIKNVEASNPSIYAEKEVYIA